ITFDIVLDLSLVGFLSVVSAILADEGISIYAISTYLRDHILVKTSEVEKTIQVLENLINRCNNTND
ncbi:MAG: ACT domain-containing protein, partial [Candidatus Bathyarchaeota archaeon]|nr:ACT domain-containing protein [Candidatus Bathyarchaeota archaeon]